MQEPSLPAAKQKHWGLRAAVGAVGPLFQLGIIGKSHCGTFQTGHPGLHQTKSIYENIK